MSAKEEEPSEMEEDLPNMSLMDITEGNNDRGIPTAKFIDDLDAFVDSFTPPAPPELLIGAYSELHAKYKTFEATLTSKEQTLSQKVPELEKSLTLVRSLLKKKEAGESAVTRYSLADNIYAKAELDLEDGGGVVNLWLGANVMLEYSYQEAIDFLVKNEEAARREHKEVLNDLRFVRDQIVTAEVNMSRIYNWDVRRKRAKSSNTGQAAST